MISNPKGDRWKKPYVWIPGVWYIYALDSKGGLAATIVRSAVEWMEFWNHCRTRYSRFYMRRLNDT